MSDDRHARLVLTSMQRKLLMLALTFTVVGGGLTLYAWATAAVPDAAPDGASRTAADRPPSSFAPRSFDAGDSATDAPATPDTQRLIDRWSPAAFRLGFSFFVGFAIAFALRAAMQITLLVVGIIAIALIALQQTELIDFDWSRLQQPFDAAVAWLRSQTRTIQTTLSGQLPSAAAAAAGLFMGFRRG